MGIKAVSAIPGATGLFKGQRVKFMRGFLAPTISYQFLSPPNIDPSLTFTRSTTATYFNSSGILSTVAANVPRFDYNPTTLALNGLLIEQQSTNTCAYSNNFTGAGWSASGMTLTANNNTGPDGVALSASELSWASGSGTKYLQYAITPAAGAVTFSFFIRSKAGTTTFALNYYNGTSYTSGTLTATTSWQRFSYTFTATAVLSAFNIGQATDLTAGDIYIYGAQLEALPFQTAYIPTSGSAVTRSADSLVNTSIGSWYNVTQGTLLTEYYIPYSINLNRVTEFNDGTYNNRIFLNSSSSALQEAIFAVNGTGYLFNAPSISGITKAGISYGGSAQLGAHNGSFDGQYVGGVTPSTITTLNLGGGGAPSGSQMNGWLRSFQYFNTALTSSQLQTISGQL